MSTYRDMTFCANAHCGNKSCFRHRSHVPDDLDMPVAWADFHEGWPGGCPWFLPQTEEG